MQHWFWVRSTGAMFADPLGQMDVIWKLKIFVHSVLLALSWAMVSLCGTFNVTGDDIA